MKTPNKHPQTDRPVGLVSRRFVAPTIPDQAPDRDMNSPAPVAARTEPRLLQSARREAEALAWTTPFPSLFLPALVEEKLAEAFARAAKQRQVRQRSSELWIESVGLLKRRRWALARAAKGDQFSAKELT